LSAAAECSLEAGLEALGVALPCAARDKLTAYLDLLVKWNATYNLTAIRAREQMLTHHVLDSLSIARHLRAGRLLDVGSGAGLPGLVLAIWAEAALPALAVTVLDANHKKSAFLRQAKAELRLGSVTVADARVEALVDADRYTQIVSRAFSDLAEFFELTLHLARAETDWLAMKGVHPHEEIAQLPAGCTLAAVHRLNVPGMKAERHLVVLRQAAQRA
jgi:16S rRNA (guanine527-N7)-methyltransferase